MKLSVKSDYAARAVLSLARRFDQPEPTRLEEIAAENHLPPGYLVQILLELKAHRIVRSSRGKDGGYRLTRPPAEISLGDVLRCVHGKLFDTPALTNPQCPPELRESWTCSSPRSSWPPTASTSNRSSTPVPTGPGCSTSDPPRSPARPSKHPSCAAYCRNRRNSIARSRGV